MEVGALTSRWIKKVNYFHNADTFFVAELTQHVMGFIYCPREEIEWQDSLFCISRGVACRKGRMMTEGSVFGEDFILCTFVLKDRRPCYTITYLELLVLPRYIVYKLLPRYPLQKGIVRKAQVKMAVTRGVVVAAKTISYFRAQGYSEDEILILMEDTLAVRHNDRRVESILTSIKAKKLSRHLEEDRKRRPVVKKRFSKMRKQISMRIESMWTNLDRDGKVQVSPDDTEPPVVEPKEVGSGRSPSLMKTSHEQKQEAMRLAQARAQQQFSITRATSVVDEEDERLFLDHIANEATEGGMRGISRDVKRMDSEEKRGAPYKRRSVIRSASQGSKGTPGKQGKRIGPEGGAARSSNSEPRRLENAGAQARRRPSTTSNDGSLSGLRVDSVDRDLRVDSVNGDGETRHPPGESPDRDQMPHFSNRTPPGGRSSPGGGSGDASVRKRNSGSGGGSRRSSVMDKVGPGVMGAALSDLSAGRTSPDQIEEDEEEGEWNEDEDFDGGAMMDMMEELQGHYVSLDERMEGLDAKLTQVMDCLDRMTRRPAAHSPSSSRSRPGTPGSGSLM